MKITSACLIQMHGYTMDFTIFTKENSFVTYCCPGQPDLSKKGFTFKGKNLLSGVDAIEKGGKAENGRVASP